MALNPVGGSIVRTYIAESAIGAGLAVVAGTSAVNVKLPAAAGARAIGITTASVDAAGKPVGVVEFGEVVAVAGGAISRGAFVQVGGTNGRLTAAAPAAGVNAEVVGMALEAAAGDGSEFLLLVAPQRIQG
jgi:hypothetical protein